MRIVNRPSPALLLEHTRFPFTCEVCGASGESRGRGRQACDPIDTGRNCERILAERRQAAKREKLRAKRKVTA